MSFPCFTATVVTGSGRGRCLGTPTINLDLRDVPHDLEHGIYACFVEFDHSPRLPAVMHYGPRPVFDDTISCEVHVIDKIVPVPPGTLHVTVRDRMRDVTDFSHQEALLEQIQSDISAARAILGVP